LPTRFARGVAVDGLARGRIPMTEPRLVTQRLHAGQLAHHRQLTIRERGRTGDSGSQRLHGRQWVGRARIGVGQRVAPQALLDQRTVLRQSGTPDRTEQATATNATEVAIDTGLAVIRDPVVLRALVLIE
jgi:hypothetical protein